MYKIYLAAQFARRTEILTYAKMLEAAGYIVTSRWLDGLHGTTDTNKVLNNNTHPDAGRIKCAREDEEDIDDADIFVLFTEEPYKTQKILWEYNDKPLNSGIWKELMESYPGTGGRHYESGYAKKGGKQMFFVGPYENVFQDLNGNEENCVANIGELLIKLPK